MAQFEDRRRPDMLGLGELNQGNRSDKHNTITNVKCFQICSPILRRDADYHNY